jgi:DNA processing protein
MTDDRGRKTDLGHVALLAGLPRIGSGRIRWLLDRHAPADAWAVATSGDPSRIGPTRPRPDRVEEWARCRDGDPHAVEAAHAMAGIRIVLRDDPVYPARFHHDPAPPPVLFAKGTLPLADQPQVAIVGTRRCTGVGAGFARELGGELARAGVSTVSGLALGIDGAAHRGVIDIHRAAIDRDATPTGLGRPIGVVGSGLDVVYPARHRGLWESVARAGVLLSEAPLGVRPAGWRFPARNRIIAGLADIVIVVESHVAGGSLLTVEEAIQRGVMVMAVPGSVRSPAAAGTNQLISDGCHPVRDAGDVLVALGLVAPGPTNGAEVRPDPGPEGHRLLDAFDWEPATLEHLVVRAGLPVPEVSLLLHRLVGDGWVSADGAWYERLHR